METHEVQYLVFDVESVADGALIRRVRYPQDEMEPAEAVARFRADLLAETGKDFIPHTFQVPISVVIAKVAADLSLIDVVPLDEPQFRPHVLTRDFWKGWKAYRRPTWVTFNGRSFDLPLMELAAFRYGISVPDWFAQASKLRNRYNTAAHLDLHELLTNFNATWFRGGLNLAANLLGKPGKMAVQGHMVQDLFEQGAVQRINDYCCCDVLDTYFVFLRAKLLMGQIDRQREGELVEHTRGWLEERRDLRLGFAEYLDQWGDWNDPWDD
jgi:predicted PolB exonuclease-like 3'-5' exonuclease